MMIPNAAPTRRDRRSEPTRTRTAAVRPFLKWAGGKRQLLSHLRAFVPPAFSRYFEPFLGSGALFLDLCARHTIGTRQAVVSDANADLIGCYAAVARDVEDVIRELRRLATGHEQGGQQHYYEIRDREFNPLRRRLKATRGYGIAQYPAKAAAMFIYLNRTGFNGLYRLNAAGDFNVPAGRYARPTICDAANLRAVACALRSPTVELRHGSFETVVSRCRTDDFVYFDPPYAPVSRTSGFTSYTASPFTEADQRRLQEVVIDLARRGCFVVVSNSTATSITDLYEHSSSAWRAGLRGHRVPARRAINSNASRRGHVDEYIITNVTGTA